MLTLFTYRKPFTMDGIVRLVFILMTTMMVAACEREPAIEPSGNTISIGIIGPMSGDDLAKGQEGVKGIKAAQQIQPYLANGDALEFIIEDDENNPDQTVELLKWMVEEKKVAAILLMSTSASALKAGAYADGHKIPVLTLLATHTDVTKDRQYISQLSFDNSFQGQVTALFVKDDLLLDRVAVISDNDSHYSTQLAGEFIRKFTAVGGTITGSLIVDEVSGNYAEALEKLKNDGTELLYMPIEADQVLNVIRAVKEIKWEPELMGGDGLLATVVNQHRDQVRDLDGMYATDFFSKHMPLTNYGEQALKTYGKMFDGDISTYAGLGAEAYKVLLNAMNGCTTVINRECISKNIRRTKNLTGIVGRISITGEGRGVRPLIVNAIRSGELRYVVKVY